MYLGSHVSIRNGYDQAARNAHAIGATAFQYFTKNPRSLAIKQFDEQAALRCADFCKENKIISISHTPYPTKLIPETKALEKQTVKSLINDLTIAEACGSIGVVVHFGSSKTPNPLEGYKKMIEILNLVLERWKGTTLLLLENNAGSGSSMGTTLEEMVQIRKLTIAPEKIGYCFDTCHAYASGLWNGDNWHEITDKGQEIGFFSQLKAIHLNNSKYPSGNRKDRHANIRNGNIKEAQWVKFLYSPVIKNIPLILETPDDEGITHAEEIQYVKDLSEFHNYQKRAISNYM